MSDIFPQVPRLIRTLKIVYIYQGQPSAYDPSYYEGEERRLREDAILEQYPFSGYADRIRRERDAERGSDEQAKPMPGQRLSLGV